MYRFCELIPSVVSDLSRNHKVLDELTSLVEQVSTEVSTERAAFTTSSARVSPVVGINQENRADESRTAPKSVEYSQINSGDGNAESVRSMDASSFGPSPEPFTPRVLSPEELAQAEDAFHFDLRSDFDETEFEEEAE